MAFRYTEGDAPTEGCITAWRIVDKTGEVQRCQLQFAHEGSAGLRWYRRALGCDIAADTEHGDYFTVEAIAHEVAYRRACDAERKAHKVYEDYRQRAVRVMEARAAFRARST